MGVTRIHVRIERLVVHGWDARDVAAYGASLRDALSHRLATAKAVEAMRSGGDRDGLRGTAPLARETDAARAGEITGQSVAGVLGG